MNDDSSPRPGLIERLTSWLLREPEDREQLLAVLHAAYDNNLLDADAAALAAAVPYVQRVARAVQAALKPDGIRVIQFNEAPAGQSVFHLHFHVVPVYAGLEIGRHGQGRADDAELAELARSIAAAL